MTSKHRSTIAYYDQNVHLLQSYYQGFGTREGDISLGFALIGDKPNANVLEIGCGFGREAEAILRRTPFYTGIDASKKVVALAKEHVPRGNFEVADILEYTLKAKYDLIFSFAALRHLDKEELTSALAKFYDALKPDGVIYLSLNYGEKYVEQMRDDELGMRLQHLYNSDLITKMAGPLFRVIHEARDIVRDVEWFEIALQKK